MELEKTSEQSGETCKSDQDVVVLRDVDDDDLTRNGVIWRLVIFAILLGFAIKPIWWSSGGDSRLYLSVARSIWQHGKLLAFGDKEIFNQIGVAIFYAPAFAFGDRPFLALSIMQWLAAVGMMVACYHWFRRYIKRDDAVLLTGLVMFNVCFWLYYLRFLTETWGCCLLMVTVLIMLKVLDAVKLNQPGKAWRWVLASLPIIIWMALTRHVTSMIAPGMAVVLLITAWQMRQKQIWIHSLLIIIILNAVAGSTAVGWLMYQRSTVSQQESVTGSYVDFVADDIAKQGQDWLRIAGDNTHRRFTNVGRAVLPGMFRTYPEEGDWLNPLSLVYAILSLALLWGFIKLTRESMDAYLWMTVFYFLLLWIMPYSAGTRFMMPVMPVLWLSLYRLLQGYKWQKTAILVLLVMHMAVTIGRVVTTYPDELDRHEQWGQMDQLAKRTLEIDPEHKWATVGMDSDWVSMLSLSIDRVFLEWREAESNPPLHIIVAKDATAPDGYVLQETLETYRIMIRQ